MKEEHIVFFQGYFTHILLHMSSVSIRISHFFSHVNNNIQLNGAKHNNVIIIYHVTYNIYIYI